MPAPGKIGALSQGVQAGGKALRIRHTVWRCVRRGPGGPSETSEPPNFFSLAGTERGEAFLGAVIFWLGRVGVDDNLRPHILVNLAIFKALNRHGYDRHDEAVDADDSGHDNWNNGAHNELWLEDAHAGDADASLGGAIGSPHVCGSGWHLVRMLQTGG